MQVLMCPPDYFDIEYEINPWMHRDNPIDKPQALSQWQSVKSALESNGIQTELISAQPGLPDMVFSANGGILHNHKFIVSHHKFPERQGEQKHFAAWAQRQGYQVHTLSHFQGGQGDALFYQDTLFAGFGFRSQLEAHQEIQQILDTRVVSLHLVDPYFYDFDTAFCPVENNLVFYYPQAFDTPSQQTLASLPHSYPVSQEASHKFACNSFSHSHHFFTSFTDHFMQQILHKYGYQIHQFDLSEFHKSGGSLKCLILSL